VSAELVILKELCGTWNMANQKESDSNESEEVGRGQIEQGLTDTVRSLPFV
jgi:hypothetical protein